MAAVLTWHRVCSHLLDWSVLCRWTKKMKEQPVSKNLKIEMKPLTVLLLATSFVFSFGCSNANRESQPIESAPASPFSAHLQSCYSAKLNGSARTVLREKVLVCRRGNDSQPVDHEFSPRFQVGRSKGQKIGFRQVVAIKFNGEVETPPAAGVGSGAAVENKSPEWMALEASAHEFLTKGCAPILNGIFQRSGFESSHRFQVLQAGDQIALSSETSKSGAVGDSFEFDDSQLQPGRAGGQRATATPSVARAPEDYRAKRAYHLLFEMSLSKETGMRLRDEVAVVDSGSLLGFVPGEVVKDSTIENSRLQFCGQLAMRIAENYGLSEGRDCKSIAAVRSESDSNLKSKADPGSSAKSSATARVGLMKPGHEISDLKKVKLAKREIHEILVPVCGPIANQKTLEQK